MRTVRLSILGLMLGLAACGQQGERQDGPKRGRELSIALEPAAQRAPLDLPPITGARDPRRPLVVIDPGHGGADPGAVSPFGGRREKDATLALSRAIRDALEASGRVRVALTRDDDRHVSLPERYEIARRLRADLFISVHADAAQRKGAQGATIYTLSEVASDQEAARLAARENAAGIQGAAALSEDTGINRILVDLAQREAMIASADFARLLHREAAPLVPFQQDFHRFASLIVLKAPDIPSILFESGYLTNAVDVAFIHSPEGRERIAEGMRRAIETHFASRRARR